MKNKNNEFEMFLNKEGEAISKQIRTIVSDNMDNTIKLVEDTFILGQASIIASILIEDPTTDILQLQMKLRRKLAEDEKLKNYVNDAIKYI